MATLAEAFFFFFLVLPVSCLMILHSSEVLSKMYSQCTPSEAPQPIIIPAHKPIIQ
jgi:hypothetical protein